MYQHSATTKREENDAETRAEQQLFNETCKEW